MNIETVITITHFSVSVKQLIGFLRACIWLPASLVLGSRHLFSALAAQLLEYLTSRGLGFGQLTPLFRVYCPFPHLISFPRTYFWAAGTRAYFWAAGTSSPRLLPIFSSNQLPADLVLGSQYLFPAFAAQTSSRQTTAEQVLAHSRLKPVAINQQVHLPPNEKGAVK